DAAGEHRIFRTRGEPEPGVRGGFVRNDTLVLRGKRGDLPLLRVSELKLLGEHNRANALAAAVAASAAGADVDALARGLRTFGGLEHRLEVVAEQGGVLWINDSKATNIGSTLVALRSMTRPTVLLLGGRHKGESYTTLLPELTAHVRVVIAFGEAAEQIEHDLGAHVHVERVTGDFE